MKARGKGVACMIYPMDPANKSSSTGVFVKVNHDGTAVLYNGSTDLGQGSNTVLAQIAAETLGIGVRDIRVITSDTDLTPYDEGTGASRITYIVGSAVKSACEQARNMLFNAAARELRFEDPQKFRVRDGLIYLDTFPETNITVAEAAYKSERVHGFPVIASATFGTLSNEPDPETGHCRTFEKFIYATQAAEVEVDCNTGQIEILRFVAVHDCGRAVNPMLLEGQIHGGVVMGLGQTLMENMTEDRETGRLINNSFADYLMPTSLDLPEQFIVDYVEVPDEDAPYGALGVSEPTPCPVAPAIANAIYDATGVRVYELPITPERMLALLNSRE